jgi:lipopolysaccharide transport protein LptA
MSRPPHTRHPLRWIRRLRAFFAVALGAVLVVIGFYFLTHLKRPAGLESNEGGFTPQRVEVQENARHFEFNRELSRMDVKWAKRTLGKDGLYHLDGPVEFVDHGKKGGREIRIKSDQAVMDKDQNFARFTGSVSIESQGLTLLADSFTYDKARDTVFNDTGVTMSSSRFHGSARNYSYSPSDGTAVLEGDVYFAIRPRSGDTQDLIIRGQRLVFNYNGRRAHFAGPVDLRHGRSQGKADALEIQLFGSKDELHYLWLMGQASIVMREPSKPGRGKSKKKDDLPPSTSKSDQSLFLFESSDQDISADQILIASFENVSRIRGLRAKGTAGFLLSGSEGRATRIEGQAVNFAFDSIRGLEAIEVRGPARLNGVSKEVPGGRTVEAPIILFDGFDRVLKAGGSEANPVHSKSEGRDIKSEKIVFYFQSNSFDAWDHVVAVLEDAPSEVSGAGGAFFAAGRPVFARARFLKYTDAVKELAFTDGVRLWQDKQVLEGPEIVLSRETQAMRGVKGVKTQFSHTPRAGGPDERIEVGGERMDYDPRTRLVTFQGKGFLRMKDIDLKSQAVSIAPEAGTGKPRLIQARGSVVLIQKLRQATGEAADYDVNQETIVMTGRPVLTDKERGTLRGDKLTFHLADGNIRVENRDQQRSDVVIKS